MSQVIKEVAEVLAITYKMPERNMHKQLECLDERMPHFR